MQEIPSDELTDAPFPAIETATSHIPDSSADLEGAAFAVSPELAKKIRTRQEDIANKRSRATGNFNLLNRRID